MFYPKLIFPIKKDRPFFYTNFVSTLDGKVAVKKEGLPAGLRLRGRSDSRSRQGYWPIGSKIDHQVLMELRAYADALIHGGNLGREFGETTAKSLNKKSFKSLRKKLGKDPALPYYVITRNPLKLSLGVNVFHPPGDNLQMLVNHLKARGYKHILVEGGPTLLGSFLKDNLIDEIFLTIAPKIYGTESGLTLTLVEGVLFSPHKIKKLKLLSVKRIADEIFLRYRII